METKNGENRISAFYHNHETVIKFAMSSFVCYLIDFALYTILVTFPIILKGIDGILSANLISRFISCAINFSINRRVVFHDKKKATRRAIEFFILAVFVLLASTFTLAFLVEHFGFNKYITKPCVDTCFFVVNWLVQRFLIFRQ